MSEELQDVSQTNLEHIRKPCDEATPGPWTLLGLVYGESPDSEGDTWIKEVQFGYEGEMGRKDARFIAAARTLMPKLLRVAELVRDHNSGVEMMRAMKDLENG